MGQLYQIAVTLNVLRKTAWYLMHHIQLYFYYIHVLCLQKYQKVVSMRGKIFRSICTAYLHTNVIGIDLRMHQ